MAGPVSDLHRLQWATVDIRRPLQGSSEPFSCASWKGIEERRPCGGASEPARRPIGLRLLLPCAVSVVGRGAFFAKSQSPPLHISATAAWAYHSLRL